MEFDLSWYKWNMLQHVTFLSNYCCCRWSSKPPRVLGCLFSAPLHIWVKYIMLCCCTWQLSTKRRNGQLTWIICCTIDLQFLSFMNICIAMSIKAFASISLCVKVGFMNCLLPTVFVRLTSLLFAKLSECIKLYANIKLLAYIYPVT